MRSAVWAALGQSPGRVPLFVLGVSGATFAVRCADFAILRLSALGCRRVLEAGKGFACASRSVGVVDLGLRGAVSARRLVDGPLHGCGDI